MTQKFRLGIVPIAVMVSLLSALNTKASSAGELTVELDGLKNKDGQVCLNIFSSSKGFPDRAKNALQKQCVQNTGSPLSVTFKDLPFGSYAVSVLHDANTDNQINRNFLGIPTEGFGFSGNPVIRSGPPEFNDSAIVVTGASTKIQIQLMYF